MSREQRKLIPRPWDKPLVWDPNVDASHIKPRDVTTEWTGTGIQIIGGVRNPDDDKSQPKKLRIPDFKDFDPKADASDWPIKQVPAGKGWAVQVIGGVRPPQAKPAETEPKKDGGQ